MGCKYTTIFLSENTKMLAKQNALNGAHN